MAVRDVPHNGESQAEPLRFHAFLNFCEFLKHRICHHGAVIPDLEHGFAAIPPECHADQGISHILYGVPGISDEVKRQELEFQFMPHHADPRFNCV